MGCLDDAMIYELVRGQLEGDALASADVHIDSCPDCRELVVGMLRTSAPAGSDAVVQRGSVVNDKYVVLDLVGGGAMGVVYAAWDTALERKVALKVLRADANWADRRERFVREAQAMAKLAHPNVVAVHEVGEVGQGVFIAMELVTGTTLREWCAGGRRGWREVRDTCVQAGRGLAAAHAAGLVHRDFKPENVIVGEDGRARVTDFGLVAGAVTNAQDPAPAEPDLQTLTVTGAVMGTPAYMAPEQFRAETVDARSDQYAFCVTLWEALYGARPFEATSFDQQVERVMAGVLPDASGPAPRWLAAALGRGLSVDPADRFGSMEQLIAALGRDLRASPGRRVAVGIAVAGVGIAAALVLGRSPAPAAAPMCTGASDAIAATWNDERAAAVRTALGGAVADTVATAVDSWRDEWIGAHTAACEATRVSGAQSEALLDARMACLGHRQQEMDALLGAFETDRERAALTAVDAVGDLPAITRCADVESLGDAIAPPSAEALRPQLAAARAQVAIGHYRAAVAMLAPLVERAGEIGFAPVVAEANTLYAQAMWRAGSPAEAEPFAFEAVLAAEAGRADYEAADAWVVLVGVAGELGKYDVALERARHAEAAVRRVGGAAELDARVQHARGVVYYNLGRFDDAEGALELARSLRVAAVGEHHPSLARTWTSLGNLERARAHYDRALAHHRKALAIERAAVGDAHPNIGRHEHNIAGVLRLQGDAAGARTHYERALTIKRTALGDQHFEVGLTHNSLGLLDLQAEQWESAARHFETAERLLEAAAHADRAVSAHNRGLAAAGRGDHRAALAHLRRAAALYDPASDRAAQVRAAIEVSTRATARKVAPRVRLAPNPGVYAPSQTWD